MNQRDLAFISGEFLNCDLPKDKEYLFKYFTTPLQEAFLRYYFTFGSPVRFCDHTGFHCSERLLYRFVRRYRELIRIHREAKSSMTEEGLRTLDALESGKYPLTEASLRHKQPRSGDV